MSSPYPDYGKVLAKNVFLDESGIRFHKNDDDSKSVTLKVTPSEVGNVDIQLPTSSGTLLTSGDSVSLSPGDIDNANLFAADVVDASALANDAVVDANIAAGANIAKSKLASLEIADADVAAGANIAYNKLSLSNAIQSGDLAGSIDYNKLNLNNSVQNGDLAGSIAYSKLSLNNAVTNMDLAGSIEYGKLSLSNAVTNGDLAGSIAKGKLADGPTTAGTVEADKFVQVDSSKDMAGARHVTAEGTMQCGSAEAFRLGDDSDGSFRIKMEAGDLVFQKKETGSWVTKHTVTSA